MNFDPRTEARFENENVTENLGVEIRGNFVSFAELRADVNAACRKGYLGCFAFTPETVEALLDYIEKNQ